MLDMSCRLVLVAKSVGGFAHSRLCESNWRRPRYPDITYCSAFPSMALLWAVHLITAACLHPCECALLVRARIDGWPTAWSHPCVLEPVIYTLRMLLLCDVRLVRLSPRHSNSTGSVSLASTRLASLPLHVSGIVIVPSSCLCTIHVVAWQWPRATNRG